MAKNQTSSLDYTNAITSAHVEEAQAFNVIDTTKLIPANHGKIILEYVPTGFNGAGLVNKAIYYSKGSYQETKIVTRGDSLGSAHKTTLNFSNRTPESLAGKSFVIYDDVGAVNVWFNVDFSTTEPVNSSTYRSIVVNLLSSQSPQIIAQKVALAMSMDAQFIGVYTLTYVIISSSSAGIKPDSYDVNSGIYIKNTAGVEPKTLNNKYFLINSANNLNEYYVWFNVAGLGSDPLLPGKTGIMVSILTGSSAVTVAEKTKEALDLTANFLTNIDNEALLVTNRQVGISNSSQEGTSDFLIFTQKSGEDREVMGTIIIEYDSQDNVSSVERI